MEAILTGHTPIRVLSAAEFNPFNSRYSEKRNVEKSLLTLSKLTTFQVKYCDGEMSRIRLRNCEIPTDMWGERMRRKHEN